jgi:hypothetical protein
MYILVNKFYICKSLVIKNGIRINKVPKRDQANIEKILHSVFQILCTF